VCLTHGMEIHRNRVLHAVDEQGLPLHSKQRNWRQPSMSSSVKLPTDSSERTIISSAEDATTSCPWQWSISGDGCAAYNSCVILRPLHLLHTNNSNNGWRTQQIHFKGVTLHLSARIIVSSPASAEIE
jgi:hypothetical protein